jgi:hypothetical protein
MLKKHEPSLADEMICGFAVAEASVAVDVSESSSMIAARACSLGVINLLLLCQHNLCKNKMTYSTGPGPVSCAVCPVAVVEPRRRRVNKSMFMAFLTGLQYVYSSTASAACTVRLLRAKSTSSGDL